MSDIFPDSKQVRQVGLENASDVSIFEFARKNNFAIVTFDSDYLDLHLVKGTLPKIIWMRTGNLTTKFVAELLLRNVEVIKQFLKSDQADIGILEIIKTDL